jgi:hypothetical protein
VFLRCKVGVSKGNTLKRKYNSCRKRPAATSRGSGRNIAVLTGSDDKLLVDAGITIPFERAKCFEKAQFLDMLALNVFVRLKLEGREELLEAVRALFDELAKEPTFLDAWMEHGQP